MTDTPSFQDLLDDFAGEVFVGRGEELSLFENALKSTKPPFLILDISGQGGVGKSTLLERYHQIARDNHVAFGLVSEDHLEVPKILNTFATQLQEDGLDFDAFKERHRKYQELKEKVEADPKAPSGLLDFAIRGATKIGLKSLKRVPIAGDVAGVFLTEDAENIIAEETSAFTKYIYKKFTNKDERVLLTDTDSELTKYFLADLTNSIKKGKAILCFDTYEKTADSIEKWVLNLISGEYGKFSGNTLILIAGRYPLGQKWMKFKKATRQVELKEFTEDEAKDYLARSEITDEKLVSQFIEVSERLPVLLALLVSSPNKLPHDVTGDAVQRFLQGLIPEQQEAALISSLPRYFNSDILKSILGEEAGKKSFEWLSKAHFVRTSENGWVYHDIVRTMMVKYFRLRSIDQFIKTQKYLEDYYKNQIENKINAKLERKIPSAAKHLYSEMFYHFLLQNPTLNIEILAKNFVRTLHEVIEEFFIQFEIPPQSQENFDLLTEVYSDSVSRVLLEISDFESEEMIIIYKNFNELLVNGPKYDNNIISWLDKISTLDDQEKVILLLIWGISSSNDESEPIKKKALEFFNSYILVKPDFMGYVSRGSYHYSNDNYKLALADLSKAIELQPENGSSYYMCGLTYYEMQDYPAALVNFSKVIELQPNNRTPYFNRGDTYYQMENYPAALADFSKAIELQSENGDNYNWRGITYFEMQDYSAALVDFSKVIELQPNNGTPYFNRGDTHYQMENYPAALADFSKAIELQPEDGDSYNRRGRTYYQMENYPVALADFSKAIELHPENGDNYNWRGLTYFQMKDFPAALVDFSKVIELQPDNRTPYFNRGDTYYQMENYPAALADFSKAIELQPEDGDNYNWRGLTYYKMQDYPAALVDFSKVIELQPNNRTPYFNRGDTYYQMENYPAALADFSKAIELQPENGDNYNWRGLTYYKMQDYSAALADLSKVIELQPNNRTPYFNRGDTHYQMENYPAALADFSKAIELQPENSKNYYWRGRTYFQMKDFPAALVDFSKAIELQPENGFNYYRSAICYFALGKNVEYKEGVRTAINLFEGKEGKSRNEKSILALCYLANKDLMKSNKLYAEIVGQHSEKDDLEYELKLLQEFTEVIGETHESKEIKKMLQDALAK